jgi:diguanylate cyclase (GGDEF)-like protein/PAS domain S-box-containing protein
LKNPFQSDDITIEELQRKIHELTLREQELLKLLRTHEALHLNVLDALPMNIFLEDPDGRTIFANEQACKMNGMKLEELVGKTVFDFFPPDIAKETREIDLQVWKQRDLLTREAKVQFQGQDGYFLTGRRIIHVHETKQDFMLGFGLNITDRVKAEEMVSHLADHDPLTDLPNRRFIKRYLDEYVNETGNEQKILGFLLLDLDRFKVINDSLGHQAGDLLLQSVADRLKNSVPETNIISRIGGDEFIILIPYMAEEDDALHDCRKILKAFEEPFTIYDQKFTITTSIGVSMFPHHGNDLNALIKSADLAMYRSKEKGRNCYSIFSANLKQRAIDRLDKEVLLREALENNEFIVHYQPKIDIHTGYIYGMEALIRWKKDEQIYYPDSFIPIAEETGLIVPIGEWVLRQACYDCSSWHKQGLKHLSISVNLSPQQFRKNNLETVIGDVLQETGLDPSALELELTESTIMQDPDNAASILNHLKSLGVRLSIDDFGTGFSSLSYLKQFPIDVLKIDKSFVMNLEWDEANASIAAAVVSLAHSLKLKVVAEGIETDAQLQYLKEHQCDYGQGYLVSHPVEMEEALRLVNKEFIPV